MHASSYAPHRFRHTSPSSPRCSSACKCSPRRPSLPTGTRRTGFVTLLRARRSALRRAARRLCGAQAGQRGDEAGQRGDQWKRQWRCPPRRQWRRPPTCQLVRATWAAQCHVPGHRAILARGQITIIGGGVTTLGTCPMACSTMPEAGRAHQHRGHRSQRRSRQMWQSWQCLISQKCR